MSDDTYSTYEAKARFSELLRRVRDGRTVTVTYHGEPVAEVRPLRRETGTAARIEELARRGALVAGPGAGRSDERPTWKPVARRPGALRRFLDDREG